MHATVAAAPQANAEALKAIKDSRWLFSTERLRVRPFRIEDAADFYQLNRHWEVVQYAEQRVCESVQDAVEAIKARPLHDYQNVGYGRFAIVDRETDSVIGFCGPKWMDDLQAVEIGYRLRPDYWRKGLATEVVSACLSYCQRDLGITRLIAIIDVDNTGSVKVAENCHLQRICLFTYASRPCYLYAIDLTGN